MMSSPKPSWWEGVARRQDRAAHRLMQRCWAFCFFLTSWVWRTWQERGSMREGSLCQHASIRHYLEKGPRALGTGQAQGPPPHMPETAAVSPLHHPPTPTADSPASHRVQSGFRFSLRSRRPQACRRPW